ncbi:MAG: hypothetical protein WBA57_00780 [Elainellaceae cyanobacterium]
MERVSPSTDTIQPMADSAQDRLMQTLAESAASEESLRIYLGRRIVFGELASGEQRRELSEDRAEMILAAIAEPSDPGVSEALDKVPAIEIRQGDEIIFRQERDGGVSVNAFQQEQTAEAVISLESMPNSEGQITDPWLGLDEVVDLEAIAQITQTLIDPLGEQTPLTEASLGDLDLRQDGEFLSLMQDETVLLTAVNGRVESPEQVSSQATETLQGWVKENVWVWREISLTEAVPESNFEAKSTANVASKAGVDLPPKESSVRVSSPSESPQKLQQKFPEPKMNQHLDAIHVVQMQFAAMAESPARQFFQRLAEDLGEQATKSMGQLRRGLESDEFKVLPQTLSNAAQEGLTKTVESMGHGLEKGGQWIASRPDALKETIETFGHRLERAGQWLSSRPQAIQEQRMARAALEVFNRGFARTQETAYEYQGFRVATQGQDRFTLSDARTQTALLQFEVERADAGDGSPKVTVTNRGDVSLEQQRAIASMRHSPEPVLGSAEAEQKHAKQSQQIEFLAKSLAEVLGTDDYQGKHYRVQVGDDAVSIIANDGRGEVFRQLGDQVNSKLEQTDFQRFAQITQVMKGAEIGGSLPSLGQDIDLE